MNYYNRIMELNLSSKWIAVAILIFGCSFRTNAEGYEPDPVKYQQALRAVVEFSCKEFATFGITIDPSKLAYGDHEIVDSFLKGREYYRKKWGKDEPLESKLSWLAELFGERFTEYETRWRRMVADSKNHPCQPLTKEEISKRLDEIKALGPSPVEMDSGLCRSSSGRAAIDVECIHCDKHTVYSELDQIYHNLPPGYYKKIADELGRLGIKVEVDGRAACPECCTNTCDFKLGKFEYKVRFKKNIDWAKVNNRKLRAMKGDQLLTVVQKCSRGFSLSGYDVNGVFEEAWLLKNGNAPYGDIYEKPGEGLLCGLVVAQSITFAEPRDEVTIPDKGTFVKIKKFHYRGIVYVPDTMVDVVTFARSSKLYDIPQTILIINGKRFPASEFTAQMLLAFAKRYSTFYSGPFNDHYAIANSEKLLREMLLGEDISK